MTYVQELAGNPPAVDASLLRPGRHGASQPDADPPLLRRQRTHGPLPAVLRPRQPRGAVAGLLGREEYLGRNTDRYYAVPTQVAQGSWSPGRDTRPWIQIILTAHFRQVRTLARHIHETDALWDRCERLARQRGVPDRSVAALCDAARGWRIQRPLYRKLVLDGAGEEISDDSATRDLKPWVDDAGLLTPKERSAGAPTYFPLK